MVVLQLLLSKKKQGSDPLNPDSPQVQESPACLAYPAFRSANLSQAPQQDHLHGIRQQIRQPPVRFAQVLMVNPSIEVQTSISCRLFPRPLWP